jgi:hypothetical protein
VLGSARVSAWQHLLIAGGAAAFVVVVVRLFFAAKIPSDKNSSRPPADEAVPVRPKPPTLPGPAGAEVDLKAFVDAADRQDELLRLRR